ncbi:hypothetical protein HELRODRAFT_62768, partial [Helobdella robusta]|uniref:non-specific serine/threonine protein kinase n=1 Tax=Helobdella robusta TaxID=6412 RepID=T1FX51_HELRO
KIQNYIVKNMLGRGSFANVYKAKCKKTSQVVAIKMIEKKNLIDKDSLQGRVRTEISIHSRLKHPFILEMYSFFEDELYIYLVLEMCENGSLSNLLKTSPDFFTEDKVRQFMQQIVTAMLYLEKHRIVHRDLTLSNLLLDKEFSIKIADFGLAVQLDDLNEKHYTMCGTPNYISPEVALKSAHGLEADVWSLGCLFYTMLVGTPPFDANDVPKTLNKVICADLFIPFSVSTQAASLIRALLQKHPNNRCKLSQILEHPFMKTQIVTLHTKKVLIVL